jgi:transcriptional antiterminator RfaH
MEGNILTDAKWYALRSKPRKERVLHHQVLSRKIECFFPRVKKNPVNPRAAKIDPYFPGYMFVKADIKHGVSSFQWMPHSLGLVGFDGEPAPIPDIIISALKKRMTEIMDNGGFFFNQLNPGTQLRIIDGPFRGYEAIFDTRLDGQERVRVLLQLVNHKQIPIRMKVGQIARKT